jgi:hypothetical protein
VNSLITPLGAPRQKRGKQALEHPIVDEFPKKQEGCPRVRNSFLKILVFMDAFHVFVVQQKEATT